MEIKKKKNPSSSSIDAGAALQFAESSFRVYYGTTGAAVPFKWESQPGTPKHSLFSDSSLPPLTPPPSYFSAPSTPSPKPKKKKNKGSTDTKLGVLLHTALPWLVSRASPNSYSSSSSSSSSMYYSPSPSLVESRKPRRRQEEADGRGRSALTCFGQTGSVNRSCGYPVSSVKNALFSVVTCRRSHSVDYIV